jgi:threonine dehydrogenase-like Zn-dependent dehydrogenase
MKVSVPAPCQWSSSGGQTTVCPAWMRNTVPSRLPRSPTPSVTCSVWPTAWRCQLVWAPGVNRTSARFAAVAAEAGPGKTVAVVGDGAVGLLAVLAARQLGAERIIAMSRHASRQRLAREFGASDIVEARGEEGVAAIKELTDGLGAHSVVEAVGTQESMHQAIRATRAGGHVGFVGVAHGVSLDGMELFWSLAHLHGGPAPVRRFLPELIELIWNRQINPGKVFDLELPLDRAADGYRAMDQRDAIKVLLRP